MSTNFLSKLDSPKSFTSSKYNLSPKIQKLSISNRYYSTLKTSLPEINIINSKPIKFDSLEQAYEEIKFQYLGISGVYKLTNKNETSRFYIGSSINLARRMDEYLKLTKGLRKFRSSSELEISKTSASDWNLEFIYITTPQTSLVYEQYAIIKFEPTMNNYINVTPRVNPQWGNSLDDAILEIEKLLHFFDKDSLGFNRLSVFLQTFKSAKLLNYSLEDMEDKYYSFLIFVYDINNIDNHPLIYSSINRALKGLQINHSTLLDHINNKYIYNSSYILSFEPVKDFSIYSEKQAGDNQLRKHIIVYNQDNEITMEFKSGREMARFFGIDGKIVRAAIAKGEYMDFLLVSKEISNRKLVYVFDSNTKELLEKINGLSKALKYAKVNYYTFKNLIENGNSFNGKIYSYKDKI
uniref:GIY-YIG homing endonuclease n=1 Tax=Ophiostoma novo-ulmi subsp. novo-ulmi TaxID=170179 RepID=A0A2L1IPW1_OPHNO|nr:GIY-YIG homing endonuclease [Ophiostoma novo-ulmi subsp. novo-ulmi]